MSAVKADAQRLVGFEGSWEAQFIVRAPFDASGDGVVGGCTLAFIPIPSWTPRRERFTRIRRRTPRRRP